MKNLRTYGDACGSTQTSWLRATEFLAGQIHRKNSLGIIESSPSPDSALAELVVDRIDSWTVWEGQMFKKLIGALVGIVVLGVAGAAQASLIGDEVTASFNTSAGSVSLSSTTGTVTTGGPEFVLNIGGGRAINIDIGGSFIDFQWDDVANAGFVPGLLSVTLADLDWVGMAGSIIAVQLTEFDDNISSFTFGPNTATFTAHSVTLNLNGTWDGTDRVRLDLTTSHVIPIPAALPLFLTGLAGLGLLRRRKRQALRE